MLNDIDLDVPKAAEDLGDGWRRCPTCAFKFKASDPRAWKRERHVRCGQRLDLNAASSGSSSQDYPLRGQTRSELTPMPLACGTVAVQGSHVAWPQVCTCCRQDATTYNEVTRTFKDSDLHAPVETVVKVMTEVRIPVCASCRSHIRGSETSSWQLMAGWIGMVAATIALFFILSQLGVGSVVKGVLLLLFMVGSMTVVSRTWRKHLDKAKLMNPDCAHSDGGVRFTGFIAPTEISPELIETRRFTFRNRDLLEDFLTENAGHAFLAEDTDEWNEPWE